MKKKFREYRMFCVISTILILFLGLTIYNFIKHQIPHAIGTGMLSLIALFLLAFRYKIILFDDMMVIYEWKIMAMLPSLIEYKDIQSIEKKSKHHLVIEHQQTSHIYVLDSDKLMDAYNSFQK